jgi:hypothetical protein
MLVYLVLLAGTIGRALTRLERGEWVDPYDESPEGPPRDLLHLMHHPFPTVLLPLYLAFLLTVAYWPNVVFILGLILMHRLYYPRRWLESWPVQMLRTYFSQREGS